MKLNVTEAPKYRTSFPHPPKAISFLIDHKMDMLFATLLVAPLFWMPLYFYLSGISISSVLEESLGYRYFYSLRLAFGHEGIWLPQGQLVSLYHVFLQKILTFYKFPNDQLFPRMDIFAILAAIVPAILTWLAFFRLSRLFTQKAFAFLLVAILIFMMHSSVLPGGAGWYLMPDYYAWALPLAIFSASLYPGEDASKGPKKSLHWYFWMGILVGLAASIKITFMLFPLTVLAVWVCNAWEREETPKLLAISLVTGFLVFASIYWACTGFSGIKTITIFLVKSYLFMKTQRGSLVGITLSLPFESYLPLLLSMVLVSLGYAERRWAILVPGVAGFIYTIFVCMRFYGHSLIEYHAFVLMLIIPLIQELSPGLLQPRFARLRNDERAVTICVMYGLALVLFAYNLYALQLLSSATARSFQNANAMAEVFHQRLAAGPSPVWILTTSDTYKPNTVESALCKGGVDIGSPTWGIASPYIASIFPKFKCAILPTGIPTEEKAELASKNTIGFAHLKDESLQDAINRVEHFFGLSLAASVCHDIAVEGSSTLTYCYPAAFKDKK